MRDYKLQSIDNEVDSFEGNRLLNTSVDDLCSYFHDKYFVDVPRLLREAIVAEQLEASVDMSHDFRYGPRLDGRANLVDGSTVKISIPFDGDSELFTVRPSTFSMSPPRASVRKGCLSLKYTGVKQSAERLKKEIDSTIDDIETNLERLRSDFGALNSSLTNHARTRIERRRNKLLENQGLVASLGYPLKANPDAPSTFVAPSVRRKIRPTAPLASTEPFKPEPCLENKEYDHILSVIGNMVQVMESSPAAFAGMGEEALRFHFLVQLNGQYVATGETFNYEGKTDILIKSNGKNIFIGECKFWGGPKVLTETIDQILGYSSWRDTKVAILVFNRNKSLTKVLEAIQTSTASHSNCKRVVGPLSETAFRYVFAHRDDPNREMVLTVMAFDIPT